MKTCFLNFNLDAFWSNSTYFTNPAPVTAAMIKDTEKLLGYKLPKSYIKLLKTKNGGSPIKECFPTKTPTSWAEDHIAISGICGIGGDWGIDSEILGSRFMIKEWGYPDIGIVLCTCPSAGHDAVMLDYSRCGKKGEPQVIHVDVEINDKPTITYLAKNFETFIRGLEREGAKSEEEHQIRSEMKSKMMIDPLYML